MLSAFQRRRRVTPDREYVTRCAGRACCSSRETPTTSLTYNLRIGTNAGAGEIVSAQAAPDTGLRRVPELGNVQFQTAARTSATCRGGIYYWSVQAVDTAFAGSPFGARTLSATEVSRTTATLNGLVHPMGTATGAWFE